MFVEGCGVSVHIAMCWDGVTETAELIVNGVTASGLPDDIEEMFAALSALNGIEGLVST